MKVSELTGKQLDYWVAKAEIDHWKDKRYEDAWIGGYMSSNSPATDWRAAGEIIDREGISIGRLEMPEKLWLADITHEGVELARAGGETPILAAMRCYVISKFGDEVPDEIYN